MAGLAGVAMLHPHVRLSPSLPVVETRAAHGRGPGLDWRHLAGLDVRVSGRLAVYLPNESNMKHAQRSFYIAKK